MNKFRGPSDGSFILVSNSLKELVDKTQLEREGKRTTREKEETICLQTFVTSNYREDKDRNTQRVPGSCMWFLKHEAFSRWSQDPTASLLWVSADPGCGKSVLSKALVDEDLLNSNDPMTTICYFFFKDDDSSRQNGANALCALLHQLFVQKPWLLKYAMVDFQHYGQNLTSQFSTLWDILETSARDPEAGKIVCVLDALDECCTASREELIQHMGRFYSSQHKSLTKLKLLTTSRPYHNIERAFHREITDMTSISLRGEDESETISREIDLVIDDRVPRLCDARNPPLELDVQKGLISCLKKFEHRTYLWLHLTLDVIRDTLESTMPRLERLIKRLPRTVEDAYEKILAKVNDSEYAQEARSLLHIVVAAVRPLALTEMRLVLAINEKIDQGEPCQSYHGLDLQSEEACHVKIRAMCGLFLIIVDSNIYLIHQTAKDFLTLESLDDISTPHNTPALGVWKRSLMPAESNLIILKICLFFLLLRDIDDKVSFMDYAAFYWDAHFQSASSRIDESVLQSTVAICEPQSYSFPQWSKKRPHWLNDPRNFKLPTTLAIASRIGFELLVEFLLRKKNVELNAQDIHGRAALHLAAAFGHSEVVKVLINEDNIELNLKDGYGRTPLLRAVVAKKLYVIDLLLEKGADVNARDERGQTPLIKAAMYRNLDVLPLLLQKKPELDIEDTQGATALQYAIEKGYSEVVRLLLDKGARSDLVTIDGQTALWWAAWVGRQDMVQLLLEKDNLVFDFQEDTGHEDPVCKRPNRGSECALYVWAQSRGYI